MRQWIFSSVEIVNTVVGDLRKERLNLASNRTSLGLWLIIEFVIITSQFSDLIHFHKLRILLLSNPRLMNDHDHYTTTAASDYLTSITTLSSDSLILTCFPISQATQARTMRAPVREQSPSLPPSLSLLVIL